MQEDFLISNDVIDIKIFNGLHAKYKLMIDNINILYCYIIITYTLILKILFYKYII